MEEYIDVRIDVFEHTGQRARLRRNLTIGNLIDEILKEFDDISVDAPGKYAIFLKGNDQPFEESATLSQLDIQPQDELVFNYGKRTMRRMLDPRNYAFLRDDGLNRIYEIQWQPAIIGRPTNEADHNIMLAVNLQLHPKGQTVSRKHAQITFSRGSFYIEPLAQNNPIFVNGKEVHFNSIREIKNGDRIFIGRNNLPMTFNTQISAQQPANELSPLPVLVSGSQPGAGSQQEIEESGPPDKNFQYSSSIEEVETFVATSSPPARLIVESALLAPKAGQILEMVNYPFLLGRDLPLLSGEGDVSRRHAEINYDARTRCFSVTDLKSTNGVTLNGVRIEPSRPYELSSGIRIGLGQHFVFRFEG